MAEDESDIVASLIASPFSRRFFTEKLQIIKNGRPTPKLELKEKVKKVERYFKTENYQRYPWMTGCKKTNRLYCWICDPKKFASYRENFPNLAENYGLHFDLPSLKTELTVI